MSENISSRPLNFIVDIHPPKQREVAEGVPNHAANLMRSLWDIDQVMHAHGLSLFAGSTMETIKVPDRETIFLRAAIILLCAAWEAYVEDLARDTLSHLIANIKEADELPLALKKRIAKGIKESRHDLSPWQLAGGSWRQFVLDRFGEDVEGLHSPKSGKIRQLYADWLGVDDVTSCWNWEYFEPSGVCSLIDGFVETRGAMAHGRPSKHTLSLNLLAYWQLLVVECSFRMSNEMDIKLAKICGSNPWGQLRQTVDWKRYTKTLDG